MTLESHHLYQDPVEITDPVTGKILAFLGNRKERRDYERIHGVRLKDLNRSLAKKYVSLKGDQVVRPLRHVASRIPEGGPFPSEMAARRAADDGAFPRGSLAREVIFS